jgi:hypothetical protein
MPSYFWLKKKLHKEKPSVKGLCFMEFYLIAAENLAYLVGFEMEVQAHYVSVLDVIHIVVNVA